MRLDGIKWGELTLVKELRHGGMADLFLVKRVFGKAEKLLVLKRIRERFASDPVARELFSSEAALHASFDHPHILQLLDFGADQGSLYMALEYAPLGDLFSLFPFLRKQDEASRKKLIADAFRNVASALTYIHRNVIHQDVSPCNILCTSEMSFKLSDFGVARKRDYTYPQDARVGRGKFRYMSPEQVGRAATDPRSDIFSLGATMAEAYCGQRLYGALSPDNIVRLIRSGDYLKYFHALRLPEDLAEIILRSVQPSPQDRFQSAEELLHALKLLEARALLHQPSSNVIPWHDKFALSAARPARRWAKIASFLLTFPILVFLPCLRRFWPSRDPARLL
jgi:serine/threonine protein kinase